MVEIQNFQKVIVYTITVLLLLSLSSSSLPTASIHPSSLWFTHRQRAQVRRFRMDPLPCISIATTSNPHPFSLLLSLPQAIVCPTLLQLVHHRRVLMLLIKMIPKPLILTNVDAYSGSPIYHNWWWKWWEGGRPLYW